MNSTRMPVLALTLAGMLTLTGGTAVAKQVRPPPTATVVGLTAQVTFAPTAGFVDDAIYADANKLIYVVADGAGTAYAHVVTLATMVDAATFNVALVTTRPTMIEPVGDALLVVGRDAEGRSIAGVVTAAGKVTWRVGPVDRITPIVRAGTLVLALARTSTRKGGKVRHTIELRALATGKRIGKVRALDLDSTGRNGKLAFVVNHLLDGGTRAVGIKDGTWDSVADQRAPNVEATYDVVAGKFEVTTAIADVRAQALRMQVLAAATTPESFVRWTPDRSSIEVWQGGVGNPVALDQPQAQYKPDSLTMAVDAASRSPWLALTVDPTNAAAVARRRTDTEYWDLFQVTGSSATRRARVLATGKRFAFGMVGNRLWVLDRNVAFDRGGTSLTLYGL